MGSSASQCSVDFDAGTGMLSFTTGAIDLLDSVGGLTGGVEAPYVGDELLNGAWSVSDLAFEGQLGDGRYEFGPGTVNIAGGGDAYGVVGNFDRYLIDDTSDDPVLTSFTLIDELFIATHGDPIDGGSLFLQEFIDRNLHGVGLQTTKFRPELGRPQPPLRRSLSEPRGPRCNHAPRQGRQASRHSPSR